MHLTDDKSEFQAALLTWFQREGRDFPWRRHADPYAILIAEKLLQQSLARDVLVRVYKRILDHYPSPKHLSKARIAGIEDIIRPLGFVYRARELITMAQELVERHNGQVPRTLDALMALTGVGDYSARAVLSFAYSEDVPVVDVNVARFLYRLYGLAGPLPTNPARKKSLTALAGSLTPPGKSREYNLAVLDLGARICRPTNPDCPHCPVRAYCEYGSNCEAIAL